MAAVVGALQGKSAMAGARQLGGRQRHDNGATFGARGYAVSTGGCEEEHMRCSHRNQEQLGIQGRDEDGDFEELRRTCIWQPLGLLTTVKPPALRGRHDSGVLQTLKQKPMGFHEMSNGIDSTACCDSEPGASILGLMATRRSKGASRICWSTPWG